MKPTNFSKYLTDFFKKYLTHEKGASTNTITSYRDTFVLFITFIERQKAIKLNKLDLNFITKEIIIEFLDWLQVERKCRTSTRNQRLAAIHSFFKYVQYQSPESLYECQKIMSIKIKKAMKPLINHLTVEGVKLLLEQPDIGTRRGRRDLALLSLMYDTGARVQEIIDLTPSALRFNKPYTIFITGKGGKSRIIPLLDEQVNILKQYMVERKLLEPNASQYPLFPNCNQQKFTRSGVSNLLLKYVKNARTRNAKLIPEKISCHSLRHSKAMHLLQAGINLVYIRDILGHVSVQTTEIYARADSKLKREALEKAYVNINPEKSDALWEDNTDLRCWLNSF